MIGFLDSPSPLLFLSQSTGSTPGNGLGAVSRTLVSTFR
jgi:hypothetical protein